MIRTVVCDVGGVLTALLTGSLQGLADRSGATMACAPRWPPPDAVPGGTRPPAA